MRRLAPILLLVFCAGWGQDGHQIVADAAWPRLPRSLRRSIGDDLLAFERACNDPDVRKPATPGEGPRHYVDIERFSGEFLALARQARGKPQLVQMYRLAWPIKPDEVARDYAAVPPNRNDYDRWRGDASDDDLGTIFYAIAETSRELARAPTLRAAGDLCHYVADLVQPLHNSANFRGQLSGNAICVRQGGHSVHERFESSMVRRFHKELAERVRAALATAPAAREPDDPVALAILHSRRAYDRITEVITADRALLASDAACATMEPADYDRALYDRVGRLTAEQLTDGVRLLVRLASPH